MFGKLVLARRHAWMVFASMFVVFALGVAVNLPAEQHGSAGAAAARASTSRRARAVGRQHVRQGGALRPGEHRGLDGRDERRLERLGQRRLRRPDAGRRRRAARQPLPRRGDLRRRRLGALRDVLLHPDRGVRRGSDGRANAGMARQEDRGARDQDRRGRRAVRADDGADADGDLDRRRTPGSRRSTTAASTASPRRSTPTTRSRTTTAARSPASARRASRAEVGHDRADTSAASCR